MALLTIIQQQANKPISQNWAKNIKIIGGVTNFVQLQTEVENSDLKTLLGASLLLDIQTNPTDAKYINLLDGKTFANSAGNNIQFRGLRYMLSYMNFGKYVAESHFADTFTGMVQKNRNESTALSSGDIRRAQKDAQDIALSDFEIMKIYLNDNSSTYPLWNCVTPRKPYTVRLTGIKKTFI